MIFSNFTCPQISDQCTGTQCPQLEKCPDIREAVFDEACMALDKMRNTFPNVPSECKVVQSIATMNAHSLQLVACLLKAVQGHNYEQ